jgi:hypothetical protein
MTATGKGPTMIAAMGVPQGWELDPVTGTGICHTEITSTAAPISANMGTYLGLSFVFCLICTTPTAINAIAIIHQRIIHCGSKIPSLMCIRSTFFDFYKILLFC